jgi:hypothetical protein
MYGGGLLPGSEIQAGDRTYAMVIIPSQATMTSILAVRTKVNARLFV